MALIKEITLDNGIITNYHRVVSVNNITNKCSILEIASYTNKTKRLEEKNAIENNQPMNVYIATEYLNEEYDKTLNVDKAYEHLKTLEKFANSTDDIE